MKKIVTWLAGFLKSVGQYLLNYPSKILFIVLLLGILITSGLVINAYVHLKNRFSKIQLKLKKYEKGKVIGPGTVVPSSSTVSRKEFDKKLKLLAVRDKKINRLLEELKKNKGQVITKTKVKVKVVTKIVYKDKPSDAQSGGLHSKKLYSKKKLHLATVQFNTKKLKKPWSYTIYPLKLKLHIFHSIKKNSPDRVGIDIKISDHKDKTVPALITDSKTTYTYPKKLIPKWSLTVSPFKLELYGLLGLNVTNKNFSGGFGLYTPILKLKYGTIDIFRFIGAGISYSGPATLNLSFYPISYNLGTTIPFIQDLFATITFNVGFNFMNQNPELNYLILFGLGTTL